MSKNIRISPKHGVNPTMGICMWCGKPTGTIAFCGRLPKDAEAPKYSVVDYEPCDECKEKWAKGVVLIEGTPNEYNPPRPRFTKDEYGEDIYPTGRWLVITVEAFSALISEKAKGRLPAPKEGTVVCVDTQVYEHIYKMFNTVNETEEISTENSITDKET